MRRTSRSPRLRGFTLIELLVAIFIILLISAVTLPTIVPALNHRRVSEAARILQAALVGARDAAIHYDDPRGIRLISDPTLPSGIIAANRILAIEPAFLEEDDHEHDSTITSVSLASDRPLDFERFRTWIGELLRTRGVDILRAKGILAFTDLNRRYVFQAVHMLMDGEPGKPWGKNEARRSRFVLIGRNLDAGELRAQFDACVA